MIIVYDAFVDTIKIIPFLFVAFLILEYIEHKFDKKSTNTLIKSKKYGPLLGSILGAFPECGFSVMASSLYASNVITMGTLIAIFLSTSDEMLPILIGEKTNIWIIIKIILVKVIVGIIIGFIIDLIFKNKKKIDIKSTCEEENCECEKHGIVVSSIIHTLKTIFFIFVANLIINYVIDFIGTDTIQMYLTDENILKYFIAALFGLIPNCASSIIITEFYLGNLISFGTLLAGLLPGAGMGVLMLFRNNHNLKENLLILSIIYIVGVLVGIILDLSLI